MKDDGIYKYYEFDNEQKVVLQADKTNKWAQSVLNELEENSKDVEFGELEASSLAFAGEAFKGTGGKFGDYIVIKGKVKAKYHTYCGQSGEPMLAPIDLRIRVCCIDEENKDKFEMEDELMILIENKEFELFFFDGTTVDIGGVVREIIFLEKENYPILL